MVGCRLRALALMIGGALWIGCAAGGTAGAAPVLLISTENGPDHVQSRIVERFVDGVRACCAGRVEAVHRFGGVLYRDRDVLGALAAGKVAMALPGTWQLDTWVPDIGALMLPVFYGRTAEEMAAVEDGPAIGAMNDAIADRLGGVVLGRWIGLGFAHVFTADRPVADADHLRGLRIRLPGGAVNAWRLAALGAEPVTIAWTDLPRALAERRVDGVVTTFATLDSINVWGSAIRFALEDRQMYTQYVPLVSGRFWGMLDTDTRRDLSAAWEAVVPEARAMTAAQQASARARADAMGVRIAVPSATRSLAVRTRLMAGQDAVVDRTGINPATVARVTAGLPR